MNYQQRASFIIRAGRLLAVGSRSGRVQVGSGPGRVGSGLNKKPRRSTRAGQGRVGHASLNFPHTQLTKPISDSSE